MNEMEHIRLENHKEEKSTEIIDDEIGSRRRKPRDRSGLGYNRLKKRIKVKRRS